MWYGHKETVCWQQTALPEGFAERMAKLGLAETYEESGWCFVESSVSAGVKVGNRRLDLSLRNEGEFHERGYAGNSRYYHKGGLMRDCATTRPVPMSPEHVAKLLHSGAKKFTNAADIDVVADLYKQYFCSITSAAQSLAFSELKWGDAQAAELAELLPRYTALRSLDLSFNQLGAVGAAKLVEALKLTKISELK